MKLLNSTLPSCGLSALCIASPGFGQDLPRLSFEAELEFGMEIANGTSAEEAASELFLTSEFGLEYTLTSQVFAFAEVSIEGGVEDENGSRSTSSTFELEQIGLRYVWGRASIELGKIALPFGSAKSKAPGYFADSFIQDYELDKSYGMSTAFAIGGGVLTTSVFALDDSLRGSIQLNDLAVQYDIANGDRTFHLGVRSISRNGDRALRELGLAGTLT